MGHHREAGDYLHTNSIEYLDGTTAQKLPEAKEGRLLLSFREIGTLAIFDPGTGEIVWTMRGPWLRQHDPDLLANGNILLFDNQGNLGPGRGSPAIGEGGVPVRRCGGRSWSPKAG